MTAITKAEIEQSISRYVTDNLAGSKNVSVSRIKNELKNLIHQEPSVYVKYAKEKLVKENDNGVKEEVVRENIKSITIGFFDMSNFDVENPEGFSIEFYL